MHSSGYGKKLDRPIKKITYGIFSADDMNLGVQIKLRSNEYGCRIQFWLTDFVLCTPCYLMTCPFLHGKVDIRYKWILVKFDVRDQPFLREINKV